MYWERRILVVLEHLVDWQRWATFDVTYSNNVRFLWFPNLDLTWQPDTCTFHRGVAFQLKEEFRLVLLSLIMNTCKYSPYSAVDTNMTTKMQRPRQGSKSGSGLNGGWPYWHATRVAGGQRLSRGPGIITCEWLLSCSPPKEGEEEARQPQRSGVVAG